MYALLKGSDGLEGRGMHAKVSTFERHGLL